MKTYLVTGAAGFIGANYIKYILAKHNDIKVVILDALTYAGNLGTIAKDIDNERCVFIKGDICSRDVVDGLFAEYRFDCRCLASPLPDPQGIIPSAVSVCTNERAISLIVPSPPIATGQPAVE